MAGAPLEGPRHPPELSHPRVALHLLRQRRRLLERLVEGDVEGKGRHQLGDAIGFPEREAHHPRNIADHRLGPHRAEGDDVGDAVRAVAIRDVADHLVAAVVGEVDVHVGHRHALGVEEALEEEPVAHRVDVGDAEAVGDQRPRGRSAPGADRDALAPREGDEIPHHEEVAREAHLDHDRELVAETLHHGVGR